MKALSSQSQPFRSESLERTWRRWIIYNYTFFRGSCAGCKMCIKESSVLTFKRGLMLAHFVSRISSFNRKPLETETKSWWNLWIFDKKMKHPNVFLMEVGTWGCSFKQIFLFVIIRPKKRSEWGRKPSNNINWYANKQQNTFWIIN